MSALVSADDCVLVVIDAQPGFYPAGEDGGEQALARAAWLSGVAVHLGVPVVVTEEDAARNGPTDAAIRAHLPDATPVLDKPCFGLAGDATILAAVRSTGRSTAVLAGCETDVCVAQSALGLQDAGLRVVVVEDATFSPGEMHARGLARMRDAGVELNHAKGLAYEWLRTLERARALPEALVAVAPFRL